VGCNTHVHGSNVRNLSVYLSLSHTRKALSFLSSLIFSLQQNWRTRGQNRFCSDVCVCVEGKVAQRMYIHVSKYKNDKIKQFKKIRIIFIYGVELV
jgi:hypothetical protein